MNVEIPLMVSRTGDGSGGPNKKVTRRDPIALRLELALVALGKNQATVCKETGIAPNALSQYLSGERTITWRQALKLKKAYGITLDWLYSGDQGQLPYALGAAITALTSHNGPRQPSSSSKRKA